MPSLKIFPFWWLKWGRCNGWRLTSHLVPWGEIFTMIMTKAKREEIRVSKDDWIPWTTSLQSSFTWARNKYSSSFYSISTSRLLSLLKFILLKRKISKNWNYCIWQAPLPSRRTMVVILNILNLRNFNHETVQSFLCATSYISGNFADVRLFDP